MCITTHGWIIRFRQTHKTEPLRIHRSQMRLNIWEMLSKLQWICLPDKKDFSIDEVDFIGHHANSTTRYLISKRVPLEQDLPVGLLRVFAMYIGNDIPKDEVGWGLKWCPVQNEMASTACTVTRVTARRTSRGHCRQDIPLGEHDRKRQRWTLPGKTSVPDEVDDEGR